MTGAAGPDERAGPAPGIRLRVPTADDAGQWFELFDDPVVMRFIGTGERRDGGWYERFVIKQQALASTTDLCLFSVLIAGRVAGFTGVQPWDHPWGATGRPELGWRLGRSSGDQVTQPRQPEPCSTWPRTRDPLSGVDDPGGQ